VITTRTYTRMQKLVNAKKKLLVKILIMIFTQHLVLEVLLKDIRTLLVVLVVLKLLTLMREFAVLLVMLDIN